MSQTNINWATHTLNLTAGCTKISAGCENCYAKAMHKRLTAMGSHKYAKPFSKFVEHWDFMLDILNCDTKLIKKPSIYFVNSMSDLFHENGTVSFMMQAFMISEVYPQHRFVYLTKRPVIMRRALEGLFDIQKPNIWLGVTVENKDKGLPRIKELQKTNHPNKFLSIEPLLEDLGELDLTGIKGVIVGGESGAKARQMQAEWVENIKQQCEAQGVKFWFKQWGKHINSPDKNDTFFGKKYQPADFWDLIKNELNYER